MASHETMFDDAFNEAYGMVEFGDSSFEAATVLKECDPIAYRCAVSDYDCDGDPECDDCEPETTPYNVYALMDGGVMEEQSFADIEAAQEYWGELVRDYRTDARKGNLNADATIHLYECHGGNMIAEVHVSATNLDNGGVDLMAHANYPHWPGYLYDCQACESKCHCTPNNSECIYDGTHNGTGE